MTRRAEELPFGASGSVRRSAGWVALVLVSFGCAATPRPRALTELDAVRQTPSVRESKERAPQAWARAEALSRRAEQAHAEDDPAKIRG
jgi:hypothetical protein